MKEAFTRLFFYALAALSIMGISNTWITVSQDASPTNRIAAYAGGIIGVMAPIAVIGESIYLIRYYSRRRKLENQPAAEDEQKKAGR